MTILLVSHFIVALHSFMYTPTMYQLLLLLLLLSLHFASVGASPQFRPSVVCWSSASRDIARYEYKLQAPNNDCTIHWMVMGWDGKGDAAADCHTTGLECKLCIE